MTQTVEIVGIPMDLGQGRRGVDMGPSAVRYAGLQARLKALGFSVVEQGNLHVPEPEEAGMDAGQQRVAAVAAVCQQVYEFGRNCHENGNFGLFLGGDHSISIGTIAAATQSDSLGIIWVDAHGDFNTPDSSPSGNIHGMPVAVSVGDGADALVNVGYEGAKVRPSQIVMIGIRDLDVEERVRLRHSGIQVFTMRDIDELGMAMVAKQAIDRLRHVSSLHISFDMDSLDPDIAAGVGTPVPGGLTYREAHLLMEMLGDTGKVNSLDVVEINPILDTRNNTAELAVELIASLLGKRIL